MFPTGIENRPFGTFAAVAAGIGCGNEAVVGSKGESAMIQAGEPPLASDAGMYTVCDPRLFGRCAVPVPDRLRLRGRQKTPRSGRWVGGHALLPDHFISP
jgi:hypothetical protein